ncbi:MAG: response regulator transcription factor [Pseudomonadota bacterium]
MKILIIEDEKRVADFLVRGLKAEGHGCVVAPDGETGLRLASDDRYDVVLLDRMLPGIDGMEVLQLLKRRMPDQRVLMLTALDAIDDRVAGLRGGADDYLGKPFDFDELLARLEALARRDGSGAAAPRLQAHGIALEEESRRTWLDDEPLELTRLEFDLLRLFMQQPGKALSRERILSRVWGSSEDPMTNVVDVYVRRLRSKIDRGRSSPIETLRGVGYRFNER